MSNKVLDRENQREKIELVKVKVDAKIQKRKYITFHYIKGGLVGKIIAELKEKYKMPTQKQIFQDALIYYKLFLEKNFNELYPNDK